MLVRCTDATRSWTGWARSQAGLSLRMKVGGVNIQLPHFFSCIVYNWAALETFTCFVLHFIAAFRVCEVISQLSHTCVKAFSRVGKHIAGNFHRWNAARMRRTNTCAYRPICASALCGKHTIHKTSIRWCIQMFTSKTHHMKRNWKKILQNNLNWTNHRTNDFCKQFHSSLSNYF